jgi:murein DD-endopeptidase MepM/ murein hydrolase activator NlpD
VVVVLAVISGCATVKSVMRASNDPAWRELASVIPMSPAIRKKMEMYQKYSAKYLKFTDGGELDETDVLDVLRDTGVVNDPAHPTTPGKPPRKSPKPPVPVYAGQYRWPVDAGVVSSEFGTRWGKNHKGIDIAGDIGEPVKAAADGVVIYSDSKMSGYGNALIIRHDDLHTTLYGHNSKLKVAVGAQVKSGQVVALLGNSGRSTGPHLHFEIREGDQAVDPRKKLGQQPF